MGYKVYPINEVKKLILNNLVNNEGLRIYQGYTILVNLSDFPHLMPALKRSVGHMYILMATNLLHIYIRWV